MSILKSIGNLIRGFFGRLVGGIEENNPGIIFAEAENKLDRTRREAENQILEIQTSAELIKIEMKNSMDNLERVRNKAEAAKKRGDIDMLAELLAEEQDLSDAFDAAREMYLRAEKEVQRIKNDFRIFEDEIKKKMNELKVLKSQTRIAALHESIDALNNRFAGNNRLTGSLNESMEKVRKTAQQKIARANAVRILKEEDTDYRLKKYDMSDKMEIARIRAREMIDSQKSLPPV